MGLGYYTDLAANESFRGFGLNMRNLLAVAGKVTPDVASAVIKLVQLKQSLGVASKTEVVRLGLAVLAWVVEELTESHKIVVQRGPNNVVELAFPYLKIKKKS